MVVVVGEVGVGAGRGAAGVGGFGDGVGGCHEFQYCKSVQAEFSSANGCPFCSTENFKSFLVKGNRSVKKQSEWRKSNMLK